MIKHARLLVSGSVQGVFFRASVAREADCHGVAGYARNLMDGRVEVVLEGEEARVQRVIDWCRTGPPTARVERVEVTWSEPAGRFRSFETC